MRVTHNLRMDLARCSCTPVVNAVQGEGNTRALIISLYDNGVSWEAPEGTTAAVAFKKADGLCGLYDKLPNGDAAVTIDGSTVTAILAPQALTVPGEVTASVVFYDQDLDRLATFPFRIRVAVDPAGGRHISNEYYNYSTLKEVNEAVDAALAALEADKQAFLTEAAEALALVHDTATADAPAIVCEATGPVIRAGDSSDRPLQGLHIYGKTTQEGTPTPDAPVALVSAGASGAINTTVCGKNLALTCTRASVNNAFEINGDNLRIYSTTAGTNQGVKYNTILLKKGVTYTASLNTTKYVSGICRFGFRYASNNSFIKGASKTGLDTLGFHSFAYTPEEDMLAYLSVLITWNPEAIMGDATFSNIQIEVGASATEYEPATGQTIAASTPNGLPGIPVASGGNYTDENGQAWICDEKDFGRGKYRQRIGKLTMDGTNVKFTGKSKSDASSLYTVTVKDLTLPNYSETKPNAILCSHGASLPYRNAFTGGEVGATAYKGEAASLRFSFGLTAEFDAIEKVNAWLANQYNAGTPMDFLYVLTEPIETALSAEELAAFAALHTNKPVTTVYNDAGADLAVEYVADTKNYIDQKLAAISAALLKV